MDSEKDGDENLEKEKFDDRFELEPDENPENKDD